MSNYKDRFDKLADELKKHPKVDLQEYKIFDPVSDDEISEVHNKIGFTLDDRIVSFYKDCNGLILKWVHHDDELYGTDHSSAVIEINSMKDCFCYESLAEFYKDNIEDEEIYIERKYLRQFDVPSSHFSIVFDITEKQPYPPMKIGVNYDAFFDDFVGFEEYIDFILKTRGILAERSVHNDLCIDLNSWPKKYYFNES